MKKKVILLAAAAALLLSSLALQAPGSICEDCQLIEIPDPDGGGSFERALCWRTIVREDGYIVCYEVHFFGDYCILDYWCGHPWIP